MRGRGKRDHANTALARAGDDDPVSHSRMRKKERMAIMVGMDGRMARTGRDGTGATAGTGGSQTESAATIVLSSG